MNLERNKNEKQNTPENFSEIKKILDLPENATNRDIYFAFSKKDQEAMKKWAEVDYTSPDLEINKAKKLLEVYEDNHPEELDRDIQDLLWLWYHHASQKVFQKGEKEQAVEYIKKALQYLDHNNMISQLLLHLYNKEYEVAEEYIQTIDDEVENQTAKELLEEFKKHHA